MLRVAAVVVVCFVAAYAGAMQLTSRLGATTVAERTLGGMVIFDGPVADAELTFLDDDGEELVVGLRTDHQGSFTFSGLLPERVTVRSVGGVVHGDPVPVALAADVDFGEGSARSVGVHVPSTVAAAFRDTTGSTVAEARAAVWATLELGDELDDLHVAIDGRFSASEFTATGAPFDVVVAEVVAAASASQVRPFPEPAANFTRSQRHEIHRPFLYGMVIDNPSRGFDGLSFCSAPGGSGRSVDVWCYPASYENVVFDVHVRTLDLGTSDFHDSDLSGVVADRRLTLRGSTFTGSTTVAGASWQRASLSGTEFHGTDMRGTDLFLASLSGAVMRDVDLSGAELRHANLHGADLRGAVGADLTSANLCNTRVADDRWLMRDCGGHRPHLPVDTDAATRPR